MVELRRGGDLSGDSLERLAHLQAMQREQAGGKTTGEMVEQLERWATAIEKQRRPASGSQPARASNNADEIPMPSELDAPLAEDVDVSEWQFLRDEVVS
jgi:hypothetical protein